MRLKGAQLQISAPTFSIKYQLYLGTWPAESTSSHRKYLAACLIIFRVLGDTKYHLIE